MVPETGPYVPVVLLEQTVSFIDELPALVWRSGPDGCCEYANRRWLQFTGRPLSEELGDGWTESIHPEDRPRCLDQLHAAVAARVPIELEYRLRRFDGAYRCVLHTLEPVLDADGIYAGHIGHCIDLTERRMAERAVERDAVLLDRVRDAMLLLGAEGEIVDANKASEAMYGYTREELLELTIRDLRAPETHSSLSANLRQAWNAGILFETVHRRKDGTRFPVEENAHAAVVDGVRVLISVVRDAADRHRIQQRLRMSEAKYRSLFENMREGVGIQELIYEQGMAVDYRILDVNPAFCTHTGLLRQSVVGRLATEAYGTGAAPYLEHYMRVVATGQPASFETYFAPLNRHLVLSAFPLGSGQFATVFADVTERKRVEEQFRQSQKMEAVGRLAGGIAHDFNNLLTIILAYTDMLLDSVGDGPLRDGIESINDAGERAAKLTSQLLTFSRKQVIQPQVLDLNQVVAETGSMVRRIIGEDIVLDIIPAANLKSVRGDPGQIGQLILNLAINARDAMPHGGKLTIETANVSIRGSGDTGAMPPGGYVMLSVADTGIGMNAEVRSHLFEPFFTTKPKGRGTGLGLSTVYGIVKQCGGEVMVESEPGAGARFDIYLPAAPSDCVPETRVKGTGQRTARGETILLVEDDRKVRELVSQLLVGLGYQVLTAGNGEEALGKLRERNADIDLLLTDVVMPGMSGPELATCTRTLQPTLP